MKKLLTLCKKSLWFFFAIVNISLLNAQTLTVHLTPSNYNNYNISCFGAKDGYIHATVTGGTAPYHYEWSNKDTTQNISNLAAGYYNVNVKDANGATTKAEITLEEPKQLEYGLQPVIYSNGFNTTCFFCNDGAIDIDISGGITPYTFNWSDGSIFQNRTGLQAKPYQVIISDANGCLQKETGVTLSAPERNDWTTNGNTGTNPGNHFIGTTDSTDLVLKSNSIERIRIKGNGDVNISSFAGTGNRILYVDSSGFFRIAPAEETNSSCSTSNPTPATWLNNGNTRAFICGKNIGIGTSTPNSRLDVSGSVKIGGSYAGNSDYTAPANGMLIQGNVGIGNGDEVFPSGYKLVVNGKVGVREIYVKASGAWPDYVLNKGYRLKTLAEIDKYFKENNRFPEMPSATEIKNDGQPVGLIQLLQQEKLEEAYLHLIAIDKRVNKVEIENQLLKKDNAAIKKELKKLRNKR